VHNAGSDYMVDCLKHVGYDYLTCMPGSTFRGIHESIINYGGNSKPEMLSAVHEEISSAMAHGYAKMAGKPMAILVHNTVGLQHASMAIYNAYAARVPMLILVGNIADARDAPARRRVVSHGDRRRRDRARLRQVRRAADASLQSFGEEIMKASSLAMTPPYEPTLVVVDADLAEDADGREAAAAAEVRAGRPSVADPAALPTLRKLLGQRAESGASSPIAARERKPAWRADRATCRELADPGHRSTLNRMNFPTNHHLYATFDRSLIAQADVILGLELTDLFAVVGDVADLPIASRRCKIKPTPPSSRSARCTTAGRRQLSGPAALLRTDDGDRGRCEASLPYLIDAVNRAMTSERRAQNAARAAHFSDAFTRAAKPNLAASRDRLGCIADQRPAHVHGDVRQIKNDDFSLVSARFQRPQWPKRLWDLDKYHHYNGDSGAYGVGYGMPAAVGAALAARDQGRYSVNFQGDGDFMVAPGSLWTAAHHKIPLLTIVHNNRAWHQETMHVQRMADRRERSPNARRSERSSTIRTSTSRRLRSRSASMAKADHATRPTRPAIARALKVVKAVCRRSSTSSRSRAETTTTQPISTRTSRQFAAGKTAAQIPLLAGANTKPK
jgi:acetolactate synthase-1/2/3 large subunit